MLTLRRSLSRKFDVADGALRVAIVAETFLPTMNGVTNSVLRLIDYLQAEGHTVMVIAPGPGPETYNGVPVVRVRSFDLPHYGSIRIGLPVLRLTSILRGFRPDIVHLAAPVVLGAAGARAARQLGVPSVAVFQTDLANFARRYGLGAGASHVWRWLRWVHNQASLTLAPSTSAMWMLHANGITNAQRWIRGVDVERFNPEHRNEALRRQLAPNGEVIVGYVGRLAREKQVHRLAPVCSLPGVRVVVVGDGPDEDRLRKLLPGARFMGFQRGAALSALHASIDIFVHTGLDETFCQAVQESLSSGAAVVAPSAGGPLDLVQHGVNGFLWSPEQPEMLVGAVAELVADPALRDRFGRQGSEGVRHRTWPVVMDELMAHYRSLLGHEPSPSTRNLAVA